MNLPAIKKDIQIILHGHLLNPPWKPRLERRRKRGEATLAAVCAYLQKYIPFVSAISPCGESGNTVENDDERIFSIWLQGEKNAPAVVRACLESIRTTCRQKLTVLDGDSLHDYIQLPDYIEHKFKEGRIRPAHYADICRVELLYRYGGIWMDATCYATSPVPKWIMDEDFFIYLGGDKIYGGYAFVQNCFFRSRRHNFLAKAWRDTIFEYWRNENSAADYFIHQILFKLVTENNQAAHGLFNAMPKLCQDPTHALWPHKDEKFDKGLYDNLCKDAFFQKTEYKSKSARKPLQGSFADYLINNHAG